MRIDEQHNAIGEHGRELREARVAVFGRDVRRHGAAGKRLEPQQQPHRIVGDLEDETAVGREGERDLRPLRLVSD
jgi:hypothetical protein